MNLLIDTAAGAIPLTSAEAQQRIDQLWDMAQASMQTAQMATRAAAEHFAAIARLMPVANPELAYQEWLQ